MTRTPGADFSSYQSLAQVSQAIHTGGIKFALVKTTEGAGYINPRARAQIAALEAAGVLVGLYHFLTHNIDGATQWDHFETTVHWATRQPPVLVCDQETDGGVLVPDNVAQAFIRRGQQRGFKVGRYGDVRVMGRRLGEDWRWYARWSQTPPAGAWDIWQNSGIGVDSDVFDGNLAALAAWWKLKSARRTTPPPARWWIHDLQQTRALGPYRIATACARLLAYAVAHPLSTRYELVRK